MVDGVDKFNVFIILV